MVYVKVRLIIFWHTNSMMKQGSEAWIEALRRTGTEQEEALEALHDYLFRAVYLYLRDARQDINYLSRTELQQMADDFAQDAVLAIQDNLDSFRGESKFTTWAYRFVINAAASELRKRYYRERLSWEEVRERETAVFQTLSTSEELDPQTAVARQQFLTQLHQIIDSELNEKQRLAFIGVYFADRSIQEIAEQLETTANTVYKILHDARKKIRAQLLARHMSEGDIVALFES
jgi:RNA polymerase sigma-70 factor (ECF subfamily)